MKKLFIIQIAVFLSFVFSERIEADVFDMPAGQTSIQFVTVGDPENAADKTGYGKVDYVYRMGKYDVTFAQYCQFLNCVAKDDKYGLYNPFMASFFPTVGISQNGTPGNYTYTVTGQYSAGVNCPIFGIDWGDAARFCNWLQNGQPTGGQGPGTTETGAYTLNGDIENLMTETRNPSASYFIPSENEWYKAAYYKGGNKDAGYWLYPTQSDVTPSNILSATGTNNANYYDEISYTDPVNLVTPVGAFAASPSPYGAYDMGGNVGQWNETIASLTSRVIRGGGLGGPLYGLSSSARGEMDPTFYYVGLRVASVPEPGSLAMLLSIAVGGLLCWRRRR